MEALCGYSTNGNGSDETVLKSQKTICYSELTAIFASSIFFIISLLIILISCKKKHKEAKRSTRFPFHHFRALCVLFLSILHILEIGEYLVASEYDSVPLVVLLTPITSLLAVIVGSVVHSIFERRGSTSWLLVQIALWAICLVCRIIRSINLSTLNLDWEHARFALSIVSTILLMLVVGTDAILYVEAMTEKDFYNVPKRNDCYLKQTSYKHNRVNAFSQITFWWLYPLLYRGYKEPLELEDLEDLPSDKSTSECFKKFIVIYEKELIASKNNGKSLSLWSCFFKFIFKNYFLGGLFKFFGDCVGLVGPLSISLIITYAGTYRDKMEIVSPFYPTVWHLLENGYVMGVIVLISIISQGTLSQSSTHLINIEGIRLKSALQSLIYHKCLKLASQSSSNPQDDKTNKSTNDVNDDKSADAGSITNLISEDSYNVLSFICIGHYIWAIPLKILVLMFLLYLKLGISAIIGALVSICVVTPLQFVVGKSMSTNSKLCVDLTDQRITKVEEVLQGMKFLKMYAWEKIYEKKILDARNEELKLLNKDSVYWALITFLTHASSALITLVTLGLHFMIDGNELTADCVFTGLALFNQLTVPLLIFPIIVPIIISAVVSTRRLKAFLDLPEINIINGLNTQHNINDNPLEKDKFSDSISIDNCEDDTYKLGNIQEIEEENDVEEIHIDIMDEKDNSSSSSQQEATNKKNSDTNSVQIIDSFYIWGNDVEKSPKINISGCLRIPKGKISLVVGKTGSGKTSFLLALIGEMNRIQGKVFWSRDSTFAYTSQKPWLLNTTIKENILFGKKLQIARYKKVIAACSLNTDLSALSHKDQTEVGEAGSTLSGGQKQRICLARAFYSDASVLLLDDPFAALDERVSKKVFERGIKKFCVNHKRTIIMVTNNVQLLPFADEIIYIDNGNVSSLGPLKHIEKNKPGFDLELKTLFNQNNADDQQARERSAKDRWNLVKLVNKFSLYFKSKNDDEDEKSLFPIRKRLSTYHGSRCFTHDLLLPSDVCDDEIIRSSFPKRSSTKRYKTVNDNTFNENNHKAAERSSSLSVSKNKVKPIPIQRQSSTPIIQSSSHIEIGFSTSKVGENNKPHRRYLMKRFFSMKDQNVNLHSTGYQIKQNSFIKRLSSNSLSKKRLTASLEMESEQMPAKRLISTHSTISDECNEDDVFCSENKASTSSNEEREYGKIPKQIYFEYFKSCGLLIAVFYLILTIAWQCMRLYTDVWLSKWTSSENNNENIKVQTEKDIKHYVIVYSNISFISILLSLSSNIIGQYAGAHARKTLHMKLLNNIIKCPLVFFQTTPLGRIINRFSIDVGIIDKKIVTSMQRLLQFIFLCLSAILLNVVINPWFLIIALPICFLYYFTQKFFRCSARELQRLDAITKSPIFSHFNETSGGVSAIRVYGQQDRFTSLLWEKMDANTNAYIILNSSNCWLGIALDYLGGIIVFVAINASLLSIKIFPEKITPALVGLAINYTLLVPIYLNWVVKFLSDMEMYMSAVERVKQYSCLPVEDYRENDVYLTKEWLQKGDIKFNNVSLRYHETKEPVISNFDLHIPAGQKIAICGRTGSGKSSLVLSLLNMIDVFEGSIVVDGTDLKSVPLHELRSKIAVVPQEISLFTGSIRDNLDPLGIYSDDKIWKALEIVQFKDMISSYPNKLEEIIREGGIGWNTGASQLMGATQALLKDSPLLLLDEPTAALDPNTASTLLRALLKSQHRQTIITVAHRLSTIIDYDRVVILDAGRIVEDGIPRDLLAKPNSIFYSMVKASCGLKI